MQPGRNDLCPCGSGRKYKHVPVFLPWFYHCWAPQPEETSVADGSRHGRTPTSIFLERRGERLEPLHRRYLQACLDAPFSFHEIRRCDAGHGFRVHDLLTGEEREVLERSASRALQAGDILFGQLVSTDSIVLIEACPLCAIPPIHKIDIIALRKRMATRQDLFARELLKDWDIELRKLYFHLMNEIVDPPPLEVHNTDGELIAPQRVIFDIDSAQLAFDALKHLALEGWDDELLASAERDADGGLAGVRFEWKKAGNRMHASWDNTILGHLEITRDRLIVDLNSTERGEAFRKIVEEALGERARYRDTEIVTQTESTAAARDAEDKEQARLAELPEVKERISEMMAAHFEGWVTQKLPALGDRTPLEAVEDADGREMVAALVAQAERDGQRMLPPIDEAILRKLRERLGLTVAS